MTAVREKTRSRRAKRKDAVVALCRARDIEGLRAARRRRASVTSSLVGLLSELDDLLRWRAIEALGVLAADVAGEDLAAARELVRRQFWTMTEESGGTAWHAPEAIGSMLVQLPALHEDFTGVLAGHGRTEPFEAGVAWSLWRLAETPALPLVRREEDLLLEGLERGHPLWRAHAALAAGAACLRAAQPALKRLTSDPASVSLYDLRRGEMVASTVGVVATQALDSMS